MTHHSRFRVENAELEGEGWGTRVKGQGPRVKGQGQGVEGQGSKGQEGGGRLKGQVGTRGRTEPGGRWNSTSLARPPGHGWGCRIVGVGMEDLKLNRCPKCGEPMEQGFAAKAAGLSFIEPQKFSKYASMDE